jgi:hypothetical protein
MSLASFSGVRCFEVGKEPATRGRKDGIMKTLGPAIMAVFVASATACGASNSNIGEKVNAARTDVNESLERVEDKARPAVSPVARRVDRGANQAAQKLGLRETPATEKAK